MNVITENEIVYIDSPNSEDAETFLYAEGPNIADAVKSGAKMGISNVQEFKGANVKANEPSKAEKEKARKKGLVWDSVKKGFVKAQELGIVDSLLSKIGITPKTSDVPEVGVNDLSNQNASNEGMSTTTKVLIGVGLVAVIGLIVYSSKK